MVHKQVSIPRETELPREIKYVTDETKYWNQNLVQCFSLLAEHVWRGETKRKKRNTRTESGSEREG